MDRVPRNSRIQALRDRFYEKNFAAAGAPIDDSQEVVFAENPGSTL
jgi:hypothetical protein